MKQKKRCKTCHIRHINARNTAYLISYRAFCFECIKYVQNFSLKHSRTQELSYISDETDNRI